jgi:Interleukin-like EMT inducer
VSWGISDTSANVYSNRYISINGNRVTYISSGFNLVELNVSSCSSANVRNYYASIFNNNSYTIMASYINSLPLNTVLIGSTGNDVQQYMTANATSALLAIGVNVTGLQYGAKVAFMARIGQPTKTFSQLAPPRGNYLKTIWTVTGEQLRSITVCLCDSKYHL